MLSCTCITIAIQPSQGGPLACLSMYFYPWCLAELYRLMLKDVILQIPHLPDVQHRAATEPSKYSVFPRISVDAEATTSTKRIASQGDTAKGSMSLAELKKRGKRVCMTYHTIVALTSKHPPSQCSRNVARANKKTILGVFQH